MASKAECSGVPELKDLNDERLAVLIDAPDDDARTAAIEAILGDVRPIIGQVLRYAKGSLLAEDLEDIQSVVNLHLFRRLELAPLYEDDAIRSLDAFVAVLTYNAIHDLLRRRFPERTRLKRRLRYLFAHEPRLALWQSGDELLCGRVEWRDKRKAGNAPEPESASRVMRDGSAPAEALLAIFGKVGMPLVFDSVVDIAATFWGIADATTTSADQVPAKADAPHARLEARQYLASLWSEIRQLRGPQRAALLLNLRDDNGGNALIHVMSAGIATLEEISEAAGMAPGRLEALWDDLPLGDAAIGEILGLARQQVINLRKSARERLARRMRR
jgi:hypothetical protein